MFWGLIMEPNKRYTQTVDKSFHVSMASLDASTADDNMVQVMLCYEDRNYLLCSLKKGTTWQVPLDLNFQEGTKIAFTCNGHGHVHLTGYLIPDEDMEDLDDMEEEEEEEDEEEAVTEVKDKHSKRKALNNAKNENKAKRAKQEAEVESSDDDDLELDGLDEDSEDSEEDDEAVNEEEDDSDEEEEDEDEVEEEEEEEAKPQPQKGKKNKQAQQQQQQQQQQKKKDEKKKMVNGKEAKQEQQQGQEQKKKKNKQQNQNAQNAQNEQNEPKKRVVEGGVQVEELKLGNGQPAKPGRFVSVYYVGRLKNGKKFDSTTQGDGFKFRLGKGEVIKGWDVGVAGMKVGGKRRLTIPAAMAYGAKGSPPVIPGNSTLIFEVELKNVH